MTNLRSRELFAVFVACFVLYEFTLAGRLAEPFPDLWRLDADSYRLAFTHTGHHPMANYLTLKHPLVVAIGIPLHRIGRLLSQPFPMPFRENLALNFPGAVIGSLNVCVALLLFRRLGFVKWRALLPTFLYATAASVWIFSSFPDSYVFTTLAANVFFLAQLSDPDVKHWRRLAFLNAVASFCAPQQILLAIVPLTRIMRSLGWKGGLRKAFLYCAALALLFVLPYLAFLAALHKLQTPTSEITRWANAGNLLSLQTWAAVSSTFLFLSQSSAWLTPEAYRPLTFASITNGGFLWLAALIVAGYALWGWRQLRSWPWLPEYSFYLAVMIGFFVAWDSRAPFLFSAPAVLPWWLILHAGHVQHQRERRWQLITVVLCCSTVFVNWQFITRLTQPHPDNVRYNPK